MSVLRRLTLLCGATAALTLFSVGAEPSAKPTQEQITKWVRQLGDDDFNRREEASKKLYEAGQAAESALEDATGSDDAEVARRATEIMDKFKWGLYPDAPKKIIDLVTRYRSSTPQGKQDVIRELLKAGPTASGPLLKIVRAEEDETIRSGLFELIRGELSLKAPQLIAGEDYDALEPLIDVLLAADAEHGAEYYAAYWLLRGKLDERIAQLKKRTGKGPEGKRTWQIIAHLYHAKGDLAAARAAADKADKPALVEALLSEDGQWKELAQRSTNLEGRTPAESLGFHAAYCRLAGDAKAFEQALSDLRKLASTSPVADYENINLSKDFFLNDRPAEAVDMLIHSPNSAETAFEVLIAQAKYQAALNMADEAKKDGSPQADVLEILKARTLYLLGEKEKATAIFAHFDEAMKKSATATLPWAETLISAETRAGLKEAADKHAAWVLIGSREVGLPKRVFTVLFPKKGETAAALWQLLRGMHGEKLATDSLAQLRDLLSGQADPKLVAEVAERASISAESILDPEKKAKYLCGAAGAALACKDEKLARSLLEKAGKLGSVDALLRLGDLEADKQEWDKAEQWYAQAWDKDPKQPLAFYLDGWALKQGGRVKEGDKRMEQAHWMPLGDHDSRYSFLRSLLERGRSEDAAREGELMLRLSPAGSQYASEGMRQVALAAMRRKEYLAAAQGQERSMLVCLQSGVVYNRPAAYLWVPVLVHRLRAEGDAAAGDFAASRREADLCWTALPGDPFVPTELVPMWDKAGRKKEATELFKKYLEVQEKLCAAYPNYSGGHNAIAWLSACCRRNLDSAREHALRAVELTPNNAGALDTLAEVEFQRGDKKEALTVEKKALALEPKRPYFRKQLKRIEAGDPAADRPSEDDDD